MMNRRMILYTVGQMSLLEAGLFLIPLVCCLICKEYLGAISFLVGIGIALIIGLFLLLASRPKYKSINAKEGFVIVALTWIVMSAIGAVPFVIGGMIPNYVDAFFETVSGFTTTGATVLSGDQIDMLFITSKGLLFWRSFTHWVGGMGVIVFIMAIVPNVSDRSMHIMKAEMPGPIIGKLVPKTRDTAAILYQIYIIMTAIEVIMLCAGGMSLYESLIHAFGTAGTGGFSCNGASLAAYSSYSQWVITVFMLLFGINFNLYYLLLIRKFKNVLKSTELWVYLGFFFVSAATITINVITQIQNSVVGETIKDACFQVASIMTTTGYATTDFDLWPTLSKTILLILMFTGACAGSTGGGLKVARIVLLIKKIRNEFRHLVHPRSVNKVKYEGKIIEDETLHNVSNYFALYMICFFVMFLLLGLDTGITKACDNNTMSAIETNFSAVSACFNNIGPGIALVGPTGTYAAFSILSKIVLSVAMLLGRLELFPILLCFLPSTWTKK